MKAIKSDKCKISLILALSGKHIISSAMRSGFRDHNVSPYSKSFPGLKRYIFWDKDISELYKSNESEIINAEGSARTLNNIKTNFHFSPSAIDIFSSRNESAFLRVELIYDEQQEEMGALSAAPSNNEAKEINTALPKLILNKAGNIYSKLNAEGDKPNDKMLRNTLLSTIGHMLSHAEAKLDEALKSLKKIKSLSLITEEDEKEFGKGTDAALSFLSDIEGSLEFIKELDYESYLLNELSELELLAKAARVELRLLEEKGTVALEEQDSTVIEAETMLYDASRLLEFLSFRATDDEGHKDIEDFPLFRVLKKIRKNGGEFSLAVPTKESVKNIPFTTFEEMVDTLKLDNSIEGPFFTLSLVSHPLPSTPDSQTIRIRLPHSSDTVSIDEALTAIAEGNTIGKKNEILLVQHTPKNSLRYTISNKGLAILTRGIIKERSRMFLSSLLDTIDTKIWILSLDDDVQDAASSSEKHKEYMGTIESIEEKLSEMTKSPLLLSSVTSNILEETGIEKMLSRAEDNLENEEAKREEEQKDKTRIILLILTAFTTASVFNDGGDVLKNALHPILNKWWTIAEPIISVVLLIGWGSVLLWLLKTILKKK